jgi:hypothetical protein
LVCNGANCNLRGKAMKLIEAIIKPSKLDEVKDALNEIFTMPT